MRSESVADRILRLTAAAGVGSVVTETAWCKAIKISHSTLSVMRQAAKAGKPVNPQMETLRAIADKLEVSIDYLVYGDERQLTPRQVAIRRARDQGHPERALQAVLALPDDPDLDQRVWHLRIEAQVAELHARERQAARPPLSPPATRV